MIGRLLSLVGALVAYFCIATVISLGIGLAWMWNKGMLTEDKVVRMTAIVHGIDLGAVRERLESQESPGEEQVSLADIAAARALQFRLLELREQSVQQDLSQLSFVRTQIKEESDYAQVQTSFDERLSLMREGVLAGAEENVRLLFENIRPRQAKEQILEMLDHGEITQVVRLMAAMPVSKRAKIAGEFKTPDEEEKLAEILRQIRLGIPEITLIDQTRGELAEPLPPES